MAWRHTMPKLRYVGVSIVMAVTSTFGNLMLLNTATGVMQSTGIGLTIGTYNILGYYHGNEGSKYGTARLKQIVTNINTMGYDVVGLQEYRDQKSGDAKAFEKALQSLNPAWKMSYTKSISDSDQLNFVYNSGTLQLIGDRVIKAAATDYGCDGGSQTVRIAEFTIIATGQRFMIINGHTNPHHGPSKCDAARLNVVKGALADAKVSAYTGPLYFVGDFNANPSGSRGNEKNIESYFKSVGWSNARDIPGAVRKDGGVIDHIYYKTSSTAAPTIYETLACKIISSSNPANYTAKTTCASDHYPVKAVFGGTGSSGANCGNLTAAQRLQFNEWKVYIYDKSCVCSESTGTGVMAGDTNLNKIATYLSSKGLSANAIAGIIGNWRVESTTTLNAFIQQIGSPWPSGGYGLAQWTATRRTNGSNTGVVDALKKDARTQAYFEYYDNKYSGNNAAENGIPPGVPTEVNDAWLQVELDFMLEEFNQKQYNIGGGYTTLLKTAVPYVNDGDNIKTALNSAKSATDAALIFTTIYEKQGALKSIQNGSAAQLLATVNKRVSQAEQDLAAIGALVGSGGGSTASGAACATNTAGIIVDGMTFPLQGMNKADVGDGGGGKGSHLGNGTCPYYYAYDLMTNKNPTAAKTVNVVAITSGTISDKVTIKSYSLGGQPYGWQLGLETDDGQLYYYTHMLNQPGVETGQAVKVGDVLEIGTKDVNGEHLHIDASPAGKGRNGPFASGISRSSCSRAQDGDFVELGPTLKKLWEALEDGTL